MDMTLNDFDSKFTLKVNELENGECFGEERFETYGVDLDFVRNYNQDHVWTFLEGDSGDYLVSGFHWVNRIYYVITNEPHNGLDITVKFD